MNESLAKDIVRRIEQRDMLMDWLVLHPDFHVQVNFAVPHTQEHLCVGLHRDACFQLSKDVLKALDLQIENMKKKL